MVSRYTTFNGERRGAFAVIKYLGSTMQLRMFHFECCLTEFGAPADWLVLQRNATFAADSSSIKPTTVSGFRPLMLGTTAQTSPSVRSNDPPCPGKPRAVAERPVGFTYVGRSLCYIALDVLLQWVPTRKHPIRLKHPCDVFVLRSLKTSRIATLCNSCFHSAVCH